MSVNDWLMEWLEEGAIFLDERCFPLRIFIVRGIFPTWPAQEISFDAISVFTGKRLQGYSFKRGVDQPKHWRRVNEIEILAYASMTREEFYQSGRSSKSGA